MFKLFQPIRKHHKIRTTAKQRELLERIADKVVRTAVTPTQVIKDAENGRNIQELLMKQKRLWSFCAYFQLHFGRSSKVQDLDSVSSDRDEP